MKTKKKRLFLPLFVLSILAVLAAIYWGGTRLIPSGWFGFAYEVPANEAQARMELVDTACGWVGVHEDDGSHHFIIDLYNSITPLPQDYRVTYDDAWCAAFVSAAAACRASGPLTKRQKDRSAGISEGRIPSVSPASSGRNSRTCSNSVSLLLRAVSAATRYRSGCRRHRSSACFPMDPVDPRMDMVFIMMPSIAQ